MYYFAHKNSFRLSVTISKIYSQILLTSVFKTDRGNICSGQNGQEISAELYGKKVLTPTRKESS